MLRLFFHSKYYVTHPLSKKVREKSPNTEYFLIRIFPYFAWIRRFTVNLRIPSKYGKIRTRRNSVFGHFSRRATVERRFNESGFFNKLPHSKFYDSVSWITNALKGGSIAYWFRGNISRLVIKNIEFFPTGKLYIFLMTRVYKAKGLLSYFETCYYVFYFLLHWKHLFLTRALTL